MAKGQMRSNKEKKKPKADKAGKVKTPPPAFVAPASSRKPPKGKMG